MVRKRKKGRGRGEKREKNGEGREERRVAKKHKNAPTAETASASLSTCPLNTNLILEASAPAEGDATSFRSATVASTSISTEKASLVTGLMTIFIFFFF